MNGPAGMAAIPPQQRRDAMGDKSPKSTAKSNKQKTAQKSQAKSSAATAAAPKK
jgi:hypothetical protein